MNPQRTLFGRISINGKRTDLGHATLSTLFIRAAQVYNSTQSRNPEINLTIEVSHAKLPESSILNREAMLEQSVAAQIITNPDDESPFEGITIGRVQEAMTSPEYAAWYQYCQPDNRIGVGPAEIHNSRIRYRLKFPDCAPHFPKWIDS